jgi:SAM-dependent methyltransferase
MPIPHASWAHCYDLAYENSHGALYQRLTDLTIATIRELRQPPCSLVDFDAGTGRLSIPLARCGYTVTAVEPCQEMMDLLLAKAKDANVRVRSRVERMQDFNGQGQFDLALCVFTTVLCLLDEASLRQGLTAFAESLTENGRVLIDLPNRHAFQSYRRRTPVLDRTVTVTPVDGDEYTYGEETRCLVDGSWQEYEDRFSIRYWPAEAILSVLADKGVECEGPLHEFQGAGAAYYRGTKTS